MSNLSKLTVCSLLLLTTSACSSQSVKFIHPQTGATAECTVSGFGIGASFSESAVNGCGRLYETRGYVKLEQLTPAQRADLEARGLLPKD